MNVNNRLQAWYGNLNEPALLSTLSTLFIFKVASVRSLFQLLWSLLECVSVQQLPSSHLCDMALLMVPQFTGNTAVPTVGNVAPMIS